MLQYFYNLQQMLIVSYKNLHMNPESSKNIAEWFKKKYQEIDRKMMPLSASCIRGCDWCCYQSVEILNWEESLILHYISHGLSASQRSRIREKLLNWLDYFDSRMPANRVLQANDVFVDFRLQQAKDRFPCIFLHNRECSIYAVRPLCCRMHVTDHNFNVCKNEPLLDASPKAEQLRKVVLASIVDRVPTTLRLLNFSVTSLFKLQHRISEIEYPLLKGAL